MNKNFKYALLIWILGFTIHQGYLITSEFFGSRVIELRKGLDDNPVSNLSNTYEIENSPFEQYDIKVTPKSFGDCLLLTNKNGDFLSLILQISAGCCLFWYILKLDPNNISWQRSRLVFTSGFLIAVAFLAINFGLTHTKDYWEAISLNKDKNDFFKHFHVETRSNSFAYTMVLLTVLGAFKQVMWYYGKPK